jgi:hypothetical protein
LYFVSDCYYVTRKLSVSLCVFSCHFSVDHKGEAKSIEPVERNTADVFDLYNRMKAGGPRPIS